MKLKLIAFNALETTDVIKNMKNDTKDPENFTHKLTNVNFKVVHGNTLTV